MKKFIKRDNRGVMSMDLILQKRFRSMLSMQQTPNVVYKRGLRNKNLFFCIIKSNTRKSNKAAVFICVDTKNDKIIAYELNDGLNNVKSFKAFVINTISDYNDVATKVYLPKLVESVKLNMFLTLNKRCVEVEYYIHKTLTAYNKTLEDLGKLIQGCNIASKETLDDVVLKYNGK